MTLDEDAGNCYGVQVRQPGSDEWVTRQGWFPETPKPGYDAGLDRARGNAEWLRSEAGGSHNPADVRIVKRTIEVQPINTMLLGDLAQGGEYNGKYVVFNDRFGEAVLGRVCEVQNIGGLGIERVGAPEAEQFFVGLITGMRPAAGGRFFVDEHVYVVSDDGTTCTEEGVV